MIPPSFHSGRLAWIPPLSEKPFYLDYLGAPQPVSPKIAQNLPMQPAPQANSNEPVWHLVIKDMLKRDNFGRSKYGVSLQANNGRDVLQDAYEEALDLCVYLRQAIEERNGV